jgi:hypothetical protein
VDVVSEAEAAAQAAVAVGADSGDYGAKLVALLGELRSMRQRDKQAKAVIFSSWARWVVNCWLAAAGVWRNGAEAPAAAAPDTCAGNMRTPAVQGEHAAALATSNSVYRQIATTISTLPSTSCHCGSAWQLPVVPDVHHPPLLIGCCASPPTP